MSQGQVMVTHSPAKFIGHKHFGIIIIIIFIITIIIIIIITLFSVNFHITINNVKPINVNCQ